MENFEALVAQDKRERDSQVSHLHNELETKKILEKKICKEYFKTPGTEKTPSAVTEGHREKQERQVRVIETGQGYRDR